MFKNISITTELNVFQGVEKVGSDDRHKNFLRTRENDVWCDSRKN